MKKLLVTIFSLVFASTAIAASVDIAKPVALFETTLTERITASSTSLTLTSATTKDGSALASSTYGFIIDEGTASEEFVLADCTGTSCANLTRGVSTITGTSSVYALIKEHRRGASVKITDAPILLQLYHIISGLQNIVVNLKYSSDLQHATTSNAIVHAKWVDDRYVDKFNAESVSGVKTFSSKPVLSAGATISIEPTVATDVTSKNYVDNLVNQGAATATESVAGIAKLSVAAVDSNDPIVVGDNDPRFDNTYQIVSTSTDGYIFSTTGYGATTTLRGIPFGTSTVIEIMASSTPVNPINLVFNDDYGAYYAWNYGWWSGSTWTQYDDDSETTALLKQDAGGIYSNWSARLQIINSTTTAKVISYTQTQGSANFADIRNSASGYLSWATTSSAIHSITLGVTDSGQFGSTTIRAIVYK